MALKMESIMKCLDYDDCRMDTLLYLISLDGVDPKSVENWDSQYEDMGSLVFKTFEARRGQCDELQLAKTLASAILRIGDAIRKAESQEKRNSKKSAKSAKRGE